MNLVILVVTLTVLLFGFVVAFGAPYLPTLKKQTSTALELLNLKPGQTMLELGCGDGRVLKAAAKKGVRAVGYELNPVLVVVAWLNTLQYRRQVKIVWGNYWRKTWPPADGIFVFLLDRYMEKLNKKIIHEYAGQKIKLVSFAFPIKNKKRYAQKEGLYLYMYP